METILTKNHFIIVYIIFLIIETISTKKYVNMWQQNINNGKKFRPYVQKLRK